MCSEQIVDPTVDPTHVVLDHFPSNHLPKHPSTNQTSDSAISAIDPTADPTPDPIADPTADLTNPTTYPEASDNQIQLRHSSTNRNTD